MRHGLFVHQVAMSFSLEGYHQGCSTIDPSSQEGATSKRGYLLFVGVDCGEPNPSWRCRYAGTADDVRHAWCNDPQLADDSQTDPKRLASWFDGVLSTAVPVTRVSIDAFMDLQAQLRWDARALEKGRVNPLTLALTSSGALDVETARLQLAAENLQAVEMRLGWLLATSGGPGPVQFELGAQQAMAKLCLKLCRLHAMTLGFAH